MARKRSNQPRLFLRNRVWCIEFYQDGQRHRYSTGQTDEQAAKRFLADHEDRKLAFGITITLSEALDRYQRSRENKIMDMRRLLEVSASLKKYLGHFRIDQINQARWDDYAHNRKTRPPRRGDPSKHIPRPVAPGTLRREFNVLKAALRRAWKDDLLKKTPALETPVAHAVRDRYLTKQEARRLMDVCETPHVRVFLALAMYTGARKSSILALTWDRVDFLHSTVDFQEPGRPLTKKRRAIVPINSQLQAVLKEAHASRTCDHVVSYYGRAIPYGLRWSFRKVCERAELGWVPTPHYIKHSVVSWLAMAGVPVDAAADLVATDATTLKRVYRKFDPNYLRTVADALEL
ncbi:Integrase/recombinase (XerC/CodV family) [Granulibacter bethesdensis]|uniref:Integrase/recombinase (XerC/CodV family) n=1 Tax=Granulibacter bethesdensis TaxID=364410 RepID=A0AAN0RED8_9PROT|nr:site-specific integrase [Granulibacter bethesdensis]AHJ63227.1 Integrase/recombinase (XerC/CodV family) [Granulibacter bethesdensis]